MRIKLGPDYPKGARGSRLETDAPGLTAARTAAGLTVEQLEAEAEVWASRIRNLEGGGFENLIAVSRLQGYLMKRTGINIREVQP